MADKVIEIFEMTDGIMKSGMSEDELEILSAGLEKVKSNLWTAIRNNEYEVNKIRTEIKYGMKSSVIVNTAFEEKERNAMGYLISETTKEEREKIVAESLGNIDAACDGCMSGLVEMYQDYIDGKLNIAGTMP